MAKKVQKGKPAKKAAKPVKKAAAKPAKKVAPKKAPAKAGKKVAPKKTTKPVKKVAAKKPVKKVIAKKAAPKKVVAKKVVKKVVAKKAAKPVKKIVTKVVKKAAKAAKPTKKAVAKPVAKKAAPAKKVTAKPVAKKVVAPAKPAVKPVAKAPAKPEVKKPVAVVTPPPAAKKPEFKKPAPAPKKRERDMDLDDDGRGGRDEAPMVVEYKTPSIRKPMGPAPKPFINTDTRTRYSDSELKEFKELILKKLAEAQKDYELLKSTLSHKDDHGTDDTSPTFKLLEDGSDVLSKEETAHLASRQEKFIQNLQNALIRIENKTYGICRATGKLISKERLRSVPHATLAIEAKLEQNA
ncbi:MAG: molecular chaperone DnaK [Bacteroidetes bacterium]|nr:molecular chaperone DnaK [Bacteroidota bacterium]